MKRFSKPVTFLLVLAVCAGVTGALYINRPVTRKTRPAPPVPIVSAVDIAPQNERIYIEAFGTVIPARRVELFAEVEGRVVDQHPELVPGGMLAQGSFLVQIDPLDYELKVKESKSAVVEAESRLELERGQQIIARREWQLFEQETEPAEVSKNLALREPHLKDAMARLEAARSKLAMAELNEQRTTLYAPFNALVLEEFVEKGQLIGSQTLLATLVATDRFWVQIALPYSSLARIRFPDNGQTKGSAVQVILDLDDGPPIVRQGTVFKLLGELEPKGRMARVLVAIDDPLNLKKTTPWNGDTAAAAGKVLLGSYVKARIDAGVIENIYVIPREALRDGDRIWLLTPAGQLAVRETEVRWRRQDEVLINAAIAPGEKLILSRLQSPLPGMRLRNGAEAAKSDNPNGQPAP